MNATLCNPGAAANGLARGQLLANAAKLLPPAAGVSRAARGWGLEALSLQYDLAGT